MINYETMKKVGIVLMVFVGLFAVEADKTRRPIEDGFKNIKLWEFDSQTWSLENEILKQTANKFTASASFLPAQYKEWDGYVVTVKVKSGELGKKSKIGFIGLNVKGVSYLIRNDGLWAIYKNKSKKMRMDEAFHKQPVIPGKWYEIRIVTKGDKILGYIDGKPWLSIPDVPSPNAGISLISSHLSGEFSNFKVFPVWENESQELAGISSDVNLLGNSSFEAIVEDLPAGWRPHSYIHKWPTEKAYFDSFTIADTGVYDGKKCVCLLTKDEKHPAGLQSTGIINIFNKLATFSVFLRSDHDKTKVTINIFNQIKEIEVSKKWERYVITSKVPMASARVSVILKSKGKLWVDATQLEVSDKSSIYQSGSEYKSKSSGILVKSNITKKNYLVPLINESIKIDGHLDEKSWQTAKPVRLKLLKTLKQPQNSTIGRALCDDENLYIGYRCQVRPDQEIPTDEATRLKSPWATESVEFMLDPTGKCKGIFQMATNLAGAKAGGRGLLSTASFKNWTGEWISAGSRDNGFYSIEIKVPLAILYLDENTQKKWPYNFARGNNAIAEWLCSSPCLYSFHEPENYDIMKLPDTLNLKPFALRLMDLKLVESGKSDNFNLSGKIFNGTDTSDDFTLEFHLEGQDKPLTKTIATRKDSIGSFHIEGIKINRNKKRLKFTVRIKNKKNRVVRICEKTIKVQKAFSVFPEYSFFSREKIANVFAERNFITKQNSTINAKAILFNGTKKIKEVTLSSKDKILTFPFEMAELSPGEYVVRVTIDELPAKQCPFIVRKYQRGETKIDHLRRCAVINGKSTLVFLPGATTYVDITDDFWRIFAEKQMTTFMVWPGRPHVNMLGSYLKSAEKYGINLFLFSMPQQDLVDSPNLLGWLALDEPIGKDQVQKTIDAVNDARKTDPHHIIYCNHMQPQMAANYAGLPGDIVSIDYYPLVAPGRSIWEIGVLTRTMEEFALPRRIPTWFFVQGNYSREPTARELSAQTYIVLINGGTGVSYFFGLPRGKRAWKRFSEINKEMLILNDILLSVEDRPIFSQQISDNISATSRKLKGTTYLIAVNGRRNKVSEQFFLPETKSGNAEVMFENRTIKIENGKIKDDFEPLQRHVYKITIKEMNK